MMTLLDVLEDALCGEPEPTRPGTHAEAVARLAGISPETREALEVGLLLAELTKRCSKKGLTGPTVDVGYDGWVAEAFPPVDPDLGEQDPIEGRGPTLHAALTALLAQLP